MDLKTAIGAAEHAREQGHTSYMARAAVVLLDELQRLRAELCLSNTDWRARPIPAPPPPPPTRYVRDDRPPAADSSTLGGAA